MSAYLHLFMSGKWKEGSQFFETTLQAASKKNFSNDVYVGRRLFLRFMRKELIYFKRAILEILFFKCKLEKFICLSLFHFPSFFASVASGEKEVKARKIYVDVLKFETMTM